MAAARIRRDAGEHELLAAVRRALARRGAGVVVGIGDDAAVVRGAGLEVLTTDTMVEGIHFERSWLTSAELGRRAFRAAVSDVAAMGARPRYVLLSLELPAKGAAAVPAQEALALVLAVAREARRIGACLVGGNVSGAPALALTTTVVAEAESPPLLRSRARAGDTVFVTGSLGGSAAAVRLLGEASRRGDAAPAKTATAAFRCPPLRVALARELARRRLVRAAIDVSDGLLQDLGHVAEASGVAIRIDPAAVPVHRAAKRFGAGPARELALAGGEDYELVIAVPARSAAAVVRCASRLRTPLAAIGRVHAGPPRVTAADGSAFDFERLGYDHLRARRQAARKRR